MIVAPPDDQLAMLSSADLEIAVLPGKGADIYSIIDRATGIDVLFKTPWGWRGTERLGAPADSQQLWLTRYPGGWQQLVPHAGAAREVNGVVRGFHGEAALIAWDVIEHGPTRMRLAVDLTTAPLRLERTLEVAGPVLSVRDRIANLSPVALPVSWVQHPGFGAPFVDGHSRLYTGAHTVLTDTAAPGTVLAADTIGQFPVIAGAGGVDVDLTRIPGPGEQRAVLAALTDFDRAWFAITSPTAGFGIGMAWDPTLLPHAWFWQECHSTVDFPWFRRAYVIAVEPANVLPGVGSIGGFQRGAAPVLDGGAEWVVELSFVRFDGIRPVRGVNMDGAVDFRAELR